MNRGVCNQGARSIGGLKHIGSGLSLHEAHAHARAEERLALDSDSGSQTSSGRELHRIAVRVRIVERSLNRRLIVGHAVALGVVRWGGHKQDLVDAGIQ